MGDRGRGVEIVTIKPSCFDKNVKGKGDQFLSKHEYFIVDFLDPLP